MLIERRYLRSHILKSDVICKIKYCICKCALDIFDQNWSCHVTRLHDKDIQYGNIKYCFNQDKIIEGYNYVKIYNFDQTFSFVFTANIVDIKLHKWVLFFLVKRNRWQMKRDR